MSKTVQVKIDKSQKRIIILSEDVQKGDYIDLEHYSILNEMVLQTINENKDITNKIIADYKNGEEYKSLEEKINSKNIEISKLNQDLIYLKQNSETQKKNIINEFKNSDEFLKLQEYNNELKTEIEKLKLEKKNLIDNKDESLNKYKASDEYQQIISKANNIDQLLENQELKLKEKHKIEIDDLQKQIENLRNHKFSLNSKEVGEELERYCLNEYNNKFSQYVENCEFKKDNDVIDRTKADFIFIVYAKNLSEIDDRSKDKYICTKVLIEAKSEKDNTDINNKRLIKDHLNKFKKDMDKKDIQLGIMVTELEKDKDFLIYREPGYDNIIIIRPTVLIPLLGIIRNMYMKISSIKLDEIKFEDKKRILDKFEEFKRNILDNSINYIEKNLVTIISTAEQIKKNSQKIYDEANKILDSHLKTVKNKINNFNIKKRINEIEEIENQELQNKNKILTNTTSYIDKENVIEEKIQR